MITLLFHNDLPKYIIHLVEEDFDAIQVFSGDTMEEAELWFTDQSNSEYTRYIELFEVKDRSLYSLRRKGFIPDITENTPTLPLSKPLIEV